MHRLNLRIPRVGSKLLRALDGFLGFEGEFVESKGHGYS
jgi:hypothetical protein